MQSKAFVCDIVPAARRTQTKHAVAARAEHVFAAMFVAVVDLASIIKDE
jgi:hypothetical protein